MRHAAIPFRRLLPSTCFTGTERDTNAKKNVEYAAYEYNVYVQCDYRGEKKSRHGRARKKETAQLDNIISNASR